MLVTQHLNTYWFRDMCNYIHCTLCFAFVSWFQMKKCVTSQLSSSIKKPSYSNSMIKDISRQISDEISDILITVKRINSKVKYRWLRIEGSSSVTTTAQWKILYTRNNASGSIKVSYYIIKLPGICYLNILHMLLVVKVSNANIS